jgi:hypothetical protein
MMRVLLRKRVFMEAAGGYDDRSSGSSKELSHHAFSHVVSPYGLYAR